MKSAIALLLTLAATSAAADDGLDVYIELATGSFDSAAQAASDSRYDHAVWHIVEIWPNAGGESRWLYSENWIDGAEAPYRQRITRVSRGEEGALIAKGYRVPQPERFLGAW